MTPITRTAALPNNKLITVIDGLFTRAEIEGLYVNACSQPYYLANTNQFDIQGLQDKKLKCDIDEGFLAQTRFYADGRKEVLDQYFGDADYKLYKSYINCGIKGDSHECHTDTYYQNQGKTLLYYANRDWEPNHGGETIFYDEDKQEIVYICGFKPGRIVIFDSDIPHSARPQSFDGPNYRFTLALKFLKNVAP